MTTDQARAMARRHPRMTAALAFGIPAGLLTHLAWVPGARWNGAIPFVTMGAALAHALAGAITGTRLLHSRVGQGDARALMLGAATSLLALAFFSPAMAAFVLAGDASPVGVAKIVVTTAYTAFFAFLAAGWALLLLSAVVGWGLHRASRAA